MHAVASLGGAVLATSAALVMLTSPLAGVLSVASAALLLAVAMAHTPLARLPPFARCSLPLVFALVAVVEQPVCAAVAAIAGVVLGTPVIRWIDVRVAVIALTLLAVIENVYVLILTVARSEWSPPLPFDIVEGCTQLANLEWVGDLRAPSVLADYARPWVCAEYVMFVGCAGCPDIEEAVALALVRQASVPAVGQVLHALVAALALPWLRRPQKKAPAPTDAPTDAPDKVPTTCAVAPPQAPPEAPLSPPGRRRRLKPMAE